MFSRQESGSRPEVAVLAWLPVFLLANPVWAQTTPPGVPRPPQEAPGETPPGSPTSSWEVFMGVSGGYDTNVDFRTPDDPGDEGLAGRASVAHARRGPRGLFRFTLQGGGVHYQDLSDASHADASAALQTSYRTSSRTTLSFDAGASYVNTDLSQALIGVGLELPRSQTLEYGGGVGVELRLAERTTLFLGARYYRVEFDAPDLLDTESGRAALSLSQRLSARSDLFLTYDYLRTNSGAEGFDSHEAGVGWSRNLSRRMTLSLAAGPGYAIEPRSDGGDTTRWYYYGTAGLQGYIRRSVLKLNFRRSTNPAYGLGGNRLSYSGELSAVVPVGRRVELSLAGVHTWSEDPTGQSPQSQFVSDDARVSFSLDILRRLGLVLGYVYRRHEPEGGPAVVSHRGSLGLTWTYGPPEARASGPPDPAP
jgi:hypothetical protein